MALSRKDLLLLVVLTVLWGVNWSVMKAGVRDFAPITFRTLCMVGGVVLLAVVARVQGHSLRVRREHWRELVVLALANVVIWYVLAIWGVKLLSSGRAAILGYTMPVWTALFGWLWVRWPDTIEWWAIAYNVFRVFGVSQLLWFRLATILPPVASSLSVMLIPVVGLFSGMALLGEQPTWHDWAALGCVLVAIASVLLPARCRDPRR